MLKRTVVVLLCCASWVGAESCWKKTPEGVRQEVTCDESAKWTSNEKPPRGKMPSYQREGVKVTEIQGFKNETEEANAQIKFAQAHPAKK